MKQDFVCFVLMTVAVVLSVAMASVFYNNTH